MKTPRAVPSELLELLQAGRIPLEDYLLVTVSDAVAPFRRRLRPTELAFLRQVLEESLESDPVLRELKARLLKALNKRSRRT